MTIVETTDSDERGMNPVAMTIINPRKEYWPSRGSNQRPPVLKSATLPTELLGSVTDIWRERTLKKEIRILFLQKFHQERSLYNQAK